MSTACLARVLVVDNDPAVRQDLPLILNDFEVAIVQKSGPELLDEAEELAHKFRPHVIITDLRLFDDENQTDRKGLELLKGKAFSSAACILYSAYINEDFTITREALKQAGVFDVVSKAESPELLVKTVRAAARSGCACQRGYHLRWPAAFGDEGECVIESLFDIHRGVPLDMPKDVLGRLFPEARTVVITPLDGTAPSPSAVPRGRSVLLHARADARVPVVIKLAPTESISQEVNAYHQYVEGHLAGLFYAQIFNQVSFWDLGGICYQFIGSPLGSLKTFAEFYRDATEAEAICKPLRHFFSEVWLNRYQNTRTRLDNTLFGAYDSYLKLNTRLQGFRNQDGTMAFPGLPSYLPNPVAWVLRHKADSSVSSAQQAVTHGDLHGDNLFTNGNYAWAIDFERTRLGPMLRDFVELEQDIIIRLAVLPEEDLTLFYNFAVAVTMPLRPQELPGISAELEENEEVKKAIGVIAGLRQLAYEVTGFEDMHEYYWGLLLDALVGSSLSADDPRKREKGLLLAAVICGRLSRWDSKWPPEDWPSLMAPLHPLNEEFRIR